MRTLAPLPTLGSSSSSSNMQLLYAPPSSTSISTDNILRTFNKNAKNSYTCIASNLGSPECKDTTINYQDGTNSIATNKCIAVCPTYNNAPVQFKSGNKGWSWSSNVNDVKNTNTMKIIKPTDSPIQPIKYTTSSGEASCYYVNANSDNCKLSDGKYTGCQAFCIPSGLSEPNTSTGFLIEQKCPDDKTSCKKTELIWSSK
jgi:hypothetical protein